RKLSKDEILGRYLNIAYFGAGAYGVFAAGQTYFGKPASQLTLAEAALLAGLVQAPDTYNPVDGDMAGALNRAAYVLEAMTRAGMISESEADAARAQPVVLTTRQPPNNCTAVAPEHNDWGFFCDYLRQWWDAQPQFGETWQDRENSLRQG